MRVKRILRHDDGSPFAIPLSEADDGRGIDVCSECFGELRLGECPACDERTMGACIVCQRARKLEELLPAGDPAFPHDLVCAACNAAGSN